MTDQSDDEQARQKEEKMKKKERPDLKDAMKSLDDEDEKRPGTDDET